MPLLISPFQTGKWPQGQKTAPRLQMKDFVEPFCVAAVERISRKHVHLTNKKTLPPGPYSRPISWVLRGSQGGGRFLLGEVPLYPLKEKCLLESMPPQ